MADRTFAPAYCYECNEVVIVNLAPILRGRSLPELPVDMVWWLLLSNAAVEPGRTLRDTVREVFGFEGPAVPL